MSLQILLFCLGTTPLTFPSHHSHEPTRFLPKLAMEMTTVKNDSVSILNATSHIASLMREEGQNPLNYEPLLCTLYRSLIIRFKGTKQELEQLMDMMMDQNRKMRRGNALDSAVWCSFFDSFYKLPGNARDSYFQNVLKKIVQRGSRVHPDITMFLSISYGILHHEHSCDFHQIRMLIEAAMMDWGTLMYLQPITVSTKGSNTKWMTLLLAIYPKVVFIDADIDTFNAVLADLPMHFGKKSYFGMQNYMLHHVLPRHNVSLNVNSCHILWRLSMENTFRQSHSLHGQPQKAGSVTCRVS